MTGGMEATGGKDRGHDIQRRGGEETNSADYCGDYYRAADDTAIGATEEPAAGINADSGQ